MKPIKLTKNEKILISVIFGIKPAYRVKHYSQRSGRCEFCYKATLKSLEVKGLVKISKAGVSSLTSEGKECAYTILPSEGAGVKIA